jgi:hypothetical protein
MDDMIRFSSDYCGLLIQAGASPPPQVGLVVRSLSCAPSGRIV